MRYSRHFLFLFAALAMAMTLPKCPGQEAMDQQLDKLGKSQEATASQVSALKSSLELLVIEEEKSKKYAGELSAVVTAQANAIAQLRRSLQEAEAQVSKLSSSNTKAVRKGN